MMEGAISDLQSVLVWLGFQATLQDLAKALVLTAFVLVILMILGDVYRGEIQNTFHRVRIIPHRSRDAQTDPALREALQIPKYMIEPTLDGVFSNALFYYRYRDHIGRMRTKPLHTYRVRLRVRKAYSDNNAPGHEAYHQYSEDERSSLEKERPYSDAGRPISEIVSVAQTRSKYLEELMSGKMKGAWNDWSRLERSRWRRWLYRVKEESLREPELLGVVMKFHFPINPYFLLYKHPDTNVRSTAWLTVLTSVFALFMQIVYGAHTLPDRPEMRVVEVVRPIN